MSIRSSIDTVTGSCLWMVLVAATTVAAAGQGAPAAAVTPTGHDAFGGIWELDRGQGSAPGAVSSGDDERGSGRRGGGGGGRRGGGAGGGGGGGGRRGGGGFGGGG